MMPLDNFPPPFFLERGPSSESEPDDELSDDVLKASSHGAALFTMRWITHLGSPNEVEPKVNLKSEKL